MNFSKIMGTAALLLWIMTISSCHTEKQQEVAAIPENGPQIIINEPTENTFHSGDTLNIHIEVLDFKEMHEAKAWLIAVPQQDTLWETKRHLHDQMIVLKREFLLPAFENNIQQLSLIVHGENAFGQKNSATYQIEVRGD